MIGYRLKKALYRIWNAPINRMIYSSFGRKSFILSPLRIVGKKYISVGSNVRIKEFARIEALNRFRDPNLEICDDVNIEQGVHVICSSYLSLGVGVSIAPYCVIVDTKHPVEKLGQPNFEGEVCEGEFPVIIGEHCFIGAHSTIQPGVTLGKCVVVAANSVVVSGDYPEYSILAGSPAKIIKRIGR